MRRRPARLEDAPALGRRLGVHLWGGPSEAHEPRAASEEPIMLAYFTGVWPGAGAGIFCRTPDGEHAEFDAQPTPWAIRTMAGYPLGDREPTNVAWGKPDYRYPQPEQPEGIARVVVGDGWTLVCLWDRSEDRRGGVHASFAIEGVFGGDEAVTLARTLFPKVWARIDAHVKRPIRVEFRS